MKDSSLGPAQIPFSRNGRFALASAKSYDRQADTFTDLERDPRFESIHSFDVFAGDDRAIFVTDDPWRATSHWLEQVPFAKRLLKWWRRSSVYLVDLATGQRVARTQPPWSSPNGIEFSHDGSRMAVFNGEGVYIYNVPPEFR